MYQDSYALILGGTRGLGHEIHKVLSAHGKKCILVGRGPAPLILLDDISLICDFSSEEHTQVFVSQIKMLNLQIDHLFWVSGVLERVPFSKIKSSQILRMFDVNLRNPLLVVQNLLENFNQCQTLPFLSIVASTVGISDSPRDDEAVYAATKAAQVSLARALGKNNRNQNLKVSLFCPGGMKTGLWDNNPLESETFNSFLDPEKVGKKIISLLLAQELPYEETVIPRGSL